MKNMAGTPYHIEHIRCGSSDGGRPMRDTQVQKEHRMRLRKIEEEGNTDDDPYKNKTSIAKRIYLGKKYSVNIKNPDSPSILPITLRSTNNKVIITKGNTFSAIAKGKATLLIMTRYNRVFSQQKYVVIDKPVAK